MIKHTQVSLLGVKIDALTMNEAAETICSYASSNQPAVYVTKPYVEFLDRASKDNDILQLLNGSFLTLPDSVALQWGSHYISDPKVRLFPSLSAIITNPKTLKKIIPERFAGANFTWKLLELAEQRNLSVYLIGRPKRSTITNTAETIHRRLPNLKISGTFDGYEVRARRHYLSTQLHDLKPDLILVGIGFPRQEYLMKELTAELGHGVLIGEGGTFDYDSFGGSIRRAPAWMRRSGLEWLWRLFLEPSRISRQLAIPRFIWAVYQAKKRL